MLTLPDMPASLARRPRDRRGYPIPFTVPIVDGRPDFRSVAPRPRKGCVDRHLCALCGGFMGRRAGGWFVGGPLCAANRLFADPAMHRECAVFALKVCPFLAAPRMHYSRVDPTPGYYIAPSVATTRPDRFMLGHAPDWSEFRNGGDLLIRAEPWTALEWWQHGAPMAPEAAA